MSVHLFDNKRRNLVLICQTPFFRCCISGPSCHMLFTGHFHWETITLICILQSVSFGTTRFGSDNKQVCFQLEANKAVLVIFFRHYFPVPHPVDGAGSQPAEQ